MPLPRLYVAGPMSGYPEYNFPAFHAAARKLRHAGFLVTSPHEVALEAGVPGSLPYEEYLRRDLLKLLSEAGAVATLAGFEQSRGAQLEVHVARALGWQVQPVGFWLGEVALPRLQSGQLLRARPDVPVLPPPYRINPPAS